MRMVGKLLLDTNIVIYYLNNNPKTIVALDRQETLYLPSIVLGELLYGAYHSSKREHNIAVIREFVTIAVVLPVAETTTDLYGQIKSKLATRGNLIPDNDIWIAAIARQYELKLATNDSHFEYVDGLELVNNIC